jgi:Cu-Zn family superoxide dismutase
VCGGADARIQVLDRNGNLLKSWDMKALYNAGFINDCISDGTFMYFTDSRMQQMYRVNVSGNVPGEPELWLTFTNNEIPYTTTGTNANGIEITPDSRYLILVVSSSGKLYRIEKATKNIVEITLDTPVTSGDGLYLEGTKLYVSRNATNLIWPVLLSMDFTAGTVLGGFGNNLMFNTTLTRVGNYFLVVNGQLNRRSPPNPVLPFTVSRVPVP